MSKFMMIALSAIVLLSGCQSKSAFKFSEDIVAKEQSLVKDIEKTEDQVEMFISNQEFDSMAIVSERMEKLVDEKLEEVKAMKAPDVKEAENFKAAAIKYFAFMKSMYTSYKKYGLAESQEERDEELEEMQDILANKNKAISDMQMAQRKYAEANGFKIR